MHLLMGYTLFLTFRGLLRLESNYRPRSKEDWGRGAESRGESALSCDNNCLWGGHHSFLWECRVDLFRQGGIYTEDVEAASTGSGEASSMGKEDSPEFRGLISPALLESSHKSPFQLIGSHSLQSNALTFTVDTL